MPTYGEVGSGIFRIAPGSEKSRSYILSLGLGFVGYFTIGVPLILLWFALLTTLGLEPHEHQQLDAATHTPPALLLNPTRWDLICAFFGDPQLWRMLGDLAFAAPGILFGVVVGFGVLPVFMGRRIERRLVRRHFKHPNCLWCRYGLGGLVADRGWIKCPECFRCNPASADIYLDRHRSPWLRWPLQTLGRALRVRIPNSTLSPDIIRPRAAPQRSRWMLGLSLLSHLILILVLMASWIALLVIFWAAGEGTRWDYLTMLFNSGVPGMCAVAAIMFLPATWPWAKAAIRRLRGFDPPTSP